MDEAATRTSSDARSDRYVPPTVEVISLDCEITSYAPDEDDTPLF